MPMHRLKTCATKALVFKKVSLVCQIILFTRRGGSERESSYPNGFFADILLIIGSYL
jgi:hypothetical protein